MAPSSPASAQFPGQMPGVTDARFSRWRVARSTAPTDPSRAIVDARCHGAPAATRESG